MATNWKRIAKKRRLAEETRVRNQQYHNLHNNLRFEYRPATTMSRRTFGLKADAKMVKAPLDSLVFHDDILQPRHFLNQRDPCRTPEEVVITTAKFCIQGDLDIFRDGIVDIRFRTYRKSAAGDASYTRVVNLYLHRYLHINEFIHTVAHELRHIGQHARGESSPSLFPPKVGTKAYKQDPAEADANEFATLVMKWMWSEG